MEGSESERLLKLWGLVEKKDVVFLSLLLSAEISVLLHLVRFRWGVIVKRKSEKVEFFRRFEVFWKRQQSVRFGISVLRDAISPQMEVVTEIYATNVKS